MDLGMPHSCCSAVNWFIPHLATPVKQQQDIPLDIERLSRCTMSETSIGYKKDIHLISFLTAIRAILAVNATAAMLVPVSRAPQAGAD
jgi:hypothetical protein